MSGKPSQTGRGRKSKARTSRKPSPYAERQRRFMMSGSPDYRRWMGWQRRKQPRAASFWFTLADVIARDGPACYICGVVPEAPEVEHVMPLHAGGNNTLENAKVSCGPCNRKKGRRMPSGWRYDPMTSQELADALAGL